MRVPAGLMALVACLSSAAVARPAERHWHCDLSVRMDGGWVMVWQGYSGPGQPMGRPVHQVMFPDDAEADGIHLTANWDGTWPSLGAPFRPPVRVSVTIPLPNILESHEVTLVAAGVVPVTLRARRWPLRAGGLIIGTRDPRLARDLLTHRDWTAIVYAANGRVQHVVPFRMPVGLEDLRAQRERQVPLVREMGRDPAARCRPHNAAD